MVITTADKGGGKKKPYDDDGDNGCKSGFGHDFEFVEDAAEYICSHCGERRRPDLTDLIQ